MTRKERHDYLLRILNLPDISHKTNKQIHDIDVIKQHHRFLWDSEESLTNTSWEMSLARRYYNKLFKEYCIADLSRYKDNKVALRWRTEDEVISGKGQFQCGSKKCEERESLRSWEVNFAYNDHGECKNSLVKLRLCPLHSEQLNYTARKREVKRLTKSLQHHDKGKISKINTVDDFDNYLKPSSSLSKKSLPLSTLPTHELCVKRDNIWGRKPDVGVEKTSRETDFECYLEDLLL